MTIAEFVPHTRVLDKTDVMVTHAGLGTVASVLTFGVPLVCTPLNRDQPLNAQRVAQLGAGIALSERPTVAAIVSAIEQVLSERVLPEAARACQGEQRRGGAPAAAAELEALLD